MPGRHVSKGLSLGAGPALLAAALFGASTPLAKLLLRGVEPWMLAGILYLGSGIGLTILQIIAAAGGARIGARVHGRGWLSLGLAIFSGGVVAPVLLMTGLRLTPASNAALLLNLEGVLTALLAWFVFGENFDRRLAAGMTAIFAGSLILTGSSDRTTDGVVGPVVIAAACLAWAVDNNLTRTVSTADPMYVAALKGGVAGLVNVVIARWLGSPWPAPPVLAIAGLVGFVGYGISLVLFVLALRHIGVARTAAYFSLAPFFGGALAVIMFKDAVTLALVAAGALMALGVWLHVTERHEHEHEHVSMTEAASHRSDGRHTHVHYPDSDHRHGH